MAKTKSPKAAIHTEPQTSFGSQQAMENTRDWDKKKYDAKNQEKGHHYDFSRKHLNFAIDKNGIKPLNEISHKDMMNKYEARLLELNYVAYKGGATNQPNSYMDWVFSGDHDVMNRMAFGDQEVDFDYKHADNSHLRRMPEVEAWAKDLYNFVCAKFGEKNVFGVEVHLDETTVHAHVNMIPVGIVQTRGRAATMYQSNEDPDVVLTAAEWKKLNSARRKNFTKIVAETRESKEAVSYSGFMGKTKGARGKYLRQFHTDYHEEVGKKYGLARGDYKETLSYEEQLERRHKTASELEAETQKKLQELQERLDAKAEEMARMNSALHEKANKIQEQENVLQQQEKDISHNKTVIESQGTTIAGNETTISNQDTTIKNNDTTIEQQQKDIEQAKKDYNDVTSWFYQKGLKPRKDYIKHYEELKESYDDDVAAARREGKDAGIEEAKKEIFTAAGLKDDNGVLGSLTPKQVGEDILEKAKTKGKEEAMKDFMKAANVSWGKGKDGKPYIPSPEEVGKRFDFHRKNTSAKENLEKDKKQLEEDKKDLAQKLEDEKDKGRADKWLLKELLRCPDRQLWNDLKVFKNPTGWRCEGSYAGVYFNTGFPGRIEDASLKSALTSSLKLPYNMATAVDEGLRETVAVIFMGYVSAQIPAGGGGGGSGSDDNWWKKKDEDWFAGAFRGAFQAAQAQLGRSRPSGQKKR